MELSLLLNTEFILSLLLSPQQKITTHQKFVRNGMIAFEYNYTPLAQLCHLYKQGLRKARR